MKDNIILIFSTVILLLMGNQVVAADLHHNIRVELDPTKGMLHGTDTLTFNTGNLAPAELLLSQDARAVSIRAAGKQVEFSRKGDMITLQAPDSPLEISWSLPARNKRPVTPAHHEDPTYGVFSSISDQGTYLAEGSNWHPRMVDREATHEIAVTLPAGQWAVTAGALIGKDESKTTNTIFWKADYPLSGLSLSAGPWQIIEGSAGGIPVYAFFYLDSVDFAETYLEEVKNYLKLYQGLFGPYPFHKFAVVENFLPTGYGFPSWTLLGSQVIKLPFIVKTSLGHEVAHSWWGNGVHADLGHGNWAEGLTTYVADYLYKEKEGPEAAEAYRLKVLRDYSTLVEPQAMPLKDFRMRSDKATQAIGYGKSAMIFHQIRQRIGDQAFWKTLNSIATHYMFQEISWQVFIDKFSRQAGTNLNAVLRPWLERGDLPRLKLTGAIREQTRLGWVIRGRLEQLASIYPLQLDVLVETDRGAQRMTVEIDTAELEFALQIDARPGKIVFDPEHNLLRRLDKQEIPTTINSLRAAKGLQTDVSEKLSTRQQLAIKDLLAGMRQGMNRRAEDKLTVSAPILFARTYAELSESSLPPAMRIEPSGELFLMGNRLDAGASLFLVWQTEEDRLRALFIPGDDNSAQRTAKKIPHYGKYSYLTFSHASNTSKGIWEPSYSPLAVSFGAEGDND